LIAIGSLPLLYYQSRDGTFSASDVSRLIVGLNCGGGAVGDFNGDGLDDGLVSTDTPKFSIFWQDRSGGLGICPTGSRPCDSPAKYNVQASAVKGYRSMAIGDLNGDGRNDVLGIADTEKGGVVAVYLAR